MGHLEAAHLEYYLPDGRALLGDVSFRVGEGAVVALVGLLPDPLDLDGAVVGLVPAAEVAGRGELPEIGPAGDVCVSARIDRDAKANFVIASPEIGRVDKRDIPAATVRQLCHEHIR